jgi:hypothetical protein
VHGFLELGEGRCTYKLFGARTMMLKKLLSFDVKRRKIPEPEYYWYASRLQINQKKVSVKEF